MAVTELFRSPVMNFGQDLRAQTLVVITETVDSALEAEIAYGSTGSAVDTGSSAPLRMVARDIRWEVNWLPGVTRGTITYVGARGK